MNKYAYCTLITKEKYLKCIIGLYYSWQQTNSAYPFYVLVSDNMNQYIFQELKNFRIPYITVPYLQFTQGERFQDTINKFYAWSLIDFNKIMFLDADVILLSNIDKYFQFSEGISYAHVFIVEPNLNTFNYLISKEVQDSYLTDEDYFFEHYPNIAMNSWDINKHLLHLMFSPKYPEYFKTIKKIYQFINSLILDRDPYYIQHNNKMYQNYLLWHSKQMNVQDSIISLYYHYKK